MPSRRYYSARSGKNPEGLKLSLSMLQRLFKESFLDFARRERFQEMLGKQCPDDDSSVGTAGSDVGAYVMLRLRKMHLWPIETYYKAFTEDDIFDLMEFLFDHVSIGTDGWNHSFNNCGMHYSEFDRPAGQKEWCEAINAYLVDYDEGYELSAHGVVLRRAPEALQPLLTASLPSADPANVEARVQMAVEKFRRHSATLEDRQDAVRDLAAVLEFLRPQMKEVLDSADENDLFNLANNFGIRHHNQKQKTQYDRDIWLNWMFYINLSAIHTTLRLLVRKGKRGPNPPPGN